MFWKVSCCSLSFLSSFGVAILAQAEPNGARGAFGGPGAASSGMGTSGMGVPFGMHPGGGERSRREIEIAARSYEADLRERDEMLRAACEKLFHQEGKDPGPRPSELFSFAGCPPTGFPLPVGRPDEKSGGRPEAGSDPMSAPQRWERIR